MNLKKFLPDVLAVLFFVAVSVVYFIVPIRDGLVLTGHDHTGGVGSGVEMDQYRATHNGERTRWTNTLFCGMPTYQMSPSYRSTETLSMMEQVYQLGLPGLSAYAAYVFMMLLGFYIMLRAAYHRRHGALLSRPILAGHRGDGLLHGDASPQQSRPDELLFPVRHRFHVARFPHRRHPTEDVCQVAESNLVLRHRRHSGRPN